MIEIQKIYESLYLNRDKFIILITGGRGSGKSYNVSTFIERLTFESGHKILFCRYTMVSAAVSIIPEITKKIELDRVGKYFQVSGKEIINKRSASSIIFKGIKTSSGNQTANLKSIQGLTTFVGDEMEEWESEEDYDKLMLSIRQKGIQNRILLVLNPTTSDHWVYKKYIEKTHRLEYIDGVHVQISSHPEVLHIHSTYLDNLLYLSEPFLREVQRIRAQSLSESTVNGVFDSFAFNKSKYAAKIIGRWSDIAEGVIFENWEIGQFDSSIPYCYGQDYGFSVDPDTLIKVAVDQKGKKIYVKELYYKCGQLGLGDLYQMNKRLIDKPSDLIIADRQEGRLIEDLANLGLNIKPCYKAPGSVTAGITSMLNYAIIVDTDSFNVIQELKKYKWSNKKAGIPTDRNNHAIDSIRYAFDFLSCRDYCNDLSLLSVFG